MGGFVKQRLGRLASQGAPRPSSAQNRNFPAKTTQIGPLQAPPRNLPGASQGFSERPFRAVRQLLPWPPGLRSQPRASPLHRPCRGLQRLSKGLFAGPEPARGFFFGEPPKPSQKSRNSSFPFKNGLFLVYTTIAEIQSFRASKGQMGQKQPVSEKLRLWQRAAARYPCVRVSPKIQFNRHRVSERAAPSRERPTPSWASRALRLQGVSSSGASKSKYLRKYRNQYPVIPFFLN